MCLFYLIDVKTTLLVSTLRFAWIYQPFWRSKFYHAFVKELQEALKIPAAASFKQVSSSNDAVGIKLNETENMVYGVDGFKEALTPLAFAYTLARG